MLWSRCIQGHCWRKKLTKKLRTDKVRIKLDKEISMAVPAFRKGTRGLECALLVIFLSFFALPRTCLAVSPMPVADNAGEAFPSATSEAMPLKANIDSESKGSNVTKLNVTVDGSARLTDVRSETKIANGAKATLEEGGREKVIGDKKTIPVASMKKEEVPKAPKKKKIWSTHPAYGQRKMVKANRDMQIYVEEMSSASGGAVREGRQAQEGGGDTQEVGEGAAAGERAGNQSEDKEGTRQGHTPIIIEEMEMSEEEKVWINVNKVYWKDLSGKLMEQMVSVCAACSDPTLFHRAMHDKELCSIQNSSTRRLTFSRCFGETPTLKSCEKMRRDLLANANRTGEMNVFAHDVHHPWPFHMPHLVKIRNAYVSSKGLIYNDDMVFDPRGTCNRGYDSAIRPELARTTRHFKKVYVADHNFPGIHHELAEMGAQLMGYYPQLMEDKSIMIHTTGFPMSGGRYEPKESAFKLIDFLEINGSRLVAGDVYADEVIVTHMYCWYMDWTFRIYGTRLRALMTAVAARAGNRSGGGENNASLTTGIYFPMRGSKLETHIPLRSPASPEDNTTVTMNSNSNINNSVTATGKTEDLVELLLPGSLTSGNSTTQSGSNSTVTMKEEVDPLRPPVGQGTILVVKRSGRRRIENHDELMDALRKALDEGGEEEAQAGDGGSEDYNNGTVIIRSVGERTEEASSPASSISSSSIPSPSSSSSSSASSPSPSSSFGRQRILEVYDDNLVRDMGEIWRLFMRADIVIAPHGAGLTNVLASREGTAIYEILLPFHLSWDGSALCLCYRDMSTILGLHYYSDLPTKIKIDRFEFDEDQSNWVRKPLGMIIDVPKTIANVKHIFKERGWKFT